jgi:hypothetical protein
MLDESLAVGSASGVGGKVLDETGSEAQIS